MNLEVQQILDVGAKYGTPPNCYLEKKSNKDLDDFTKNAGYNNYTKFGRDFDALTGSKLNGQAWCAMYATMTIVEALGATRAKAVCGGAFFAKCSQWADYYKKKNLYKQGSKVVPQPGYIIFFQNSGGICHVGIVIKVSGNIIYTSEGNTSGKVSEFEPNGGMCYYGKTHTIGSANIHGYGTPQYNPEEDELQVIIDELVAKSGKTKAEVIDALAYWIKNANLKDDDWEQEGVDALVNNKFISATRMGNQPVFWGEYAISLQRVRDEITAATKKKA
jgi:hypothetical protein